MSVVRAGSDDAAEALEHLAAEEPLAIRITFGPLRDRRRTTVSVTMRTPGHEEDLAVGFLFAEGVVTDPAQVIDVARGRSGHAVRVDLHPDSTVDLSRLDRRGLTTSACGVCGKTAIRAVETACDGPRPGGTPIAPAVIHRLPDALRAAQPTFARTGGLHAAALFDRDGRLLTVREDVGRHNAVDKLIGAEVRAGRAPLHDRILLVSGRAGFELVQKAAVAGAPVFAAIGAPTTLAVELAHRLGVTLLGFVRDGRFNIYAGPERIAL
jgi:FdhD protein